MQDRRCETLAFPTQIKKHPSKRGAFLFSIWFIILYYISRNSHNQYVLVTNSHKSCFLLHFVKTAQKRADKKYKAKVETVRVELYPIGTDIKDKLAERLEAGEGRATYIKRLIREDIKKEQS